MKWPWDALTLVDRFWLLTTGVHPRRRPTHSARLGVAMAAIRAIELAGEVRWTGLDEDARLYSIADCRCPQPLRTWHDALQANEHLDLQGVAARFALDPLLADAWRQAGEHLADLGLVTVQRSRFGRFGNYAYGVAHVPQLRARRRDIIGLVAPSDGSVQDLPTDILELLVVASAADALSDLLRVPGLDPSPNLAAAIDFATRGSRARRRLEETARYRGLDLSS
ncbi:hypothetical protein BJY21_001639 [Kineosphaera limosa]|uniref:Golgi phosphoprotein 3 GPP34 n=1 Tax=Kineosphaera limosa NBRC 100340 TaxID=1184609 RepID=K6VMW4_9MICO|nr:hypothetical protein [Kineosphaera limosa]NYE00455.1 hypothetical protein [Kineosphaera limosa]GAB97568.1 hypothetical protein KILIM_074_00170 [Kineosphaera limosa NBRC 100340]